jgi:hypothetical protein
VDEAERERRTEHAFRAVLRRERLYASGLILAAFSCCLVFTGVILYVTGPGINVPPPHTARADPRSLRHPGHPYRHAGEVILASSLIGAICGVCVARLNAPGKRPRSSGARRA